MSFQYQKPLAPWEDAGQEPPVGLRKWQMRQKPPALWFNWFWDAVQKCFDNILTWFGYSILDSITDLKAFDNTTGVLSLKVKGYSVPGDKGGGVFYWDPDSTEADDGGLIIIPDTNPANGRWKRIYDGYLMAAWFGIKGDNSTDNTLKIQALIDKITVTKEPVLFNPGVYIVSNLTLKSNVWMFGYNATLVFKNTSTGDFLDLDSLSNIRLDGFTLDGLDITEYAEGTAIGARTGIHIEDCIDVILDNLIIQGFTKYGLEIVDLGYNGSWSYLRAPKLKNINAFQNYSGFYFGVRGEYTQLCSCTAGKNRTGITIAGGNTHVVNSAFNNNVYGAQLIAGDNNSHGSFTGCTFNHNTSYALVSDGIIHGFGFVNCHFFDGSIYIKDSEGLQIKNSMLSGNHFYFEGGGWNEIRGNRFVDIVDTRDFDFGYNSKPDKVVLMENYYDDGSSCDTLDATVCYIESTSITVASNITASAIVKFANVAQTLYKQDVTTIYNSSTGIGVIARRGRYAFNATIKFNNHGASAGYSMVYLKLNNQIVGAYDRRYMPASATNLVVSIAAVKPCEVGYEFQIMVGSDVGLDLVNSECALEVISLN